MSSYFVRQIILLFFKYRYRSKKTSNAKLVHHDEKDNAIDDDGFELDKNAELVGKDNVTVNDDGFEVEKKDGAEKNDGGSNQCRTSCKKSNTKGYWIGGGFVIGWSIVTVFVISIIIALPKI